MMRIAAIILALVCGAAIADPYAVVDGNGLVTNVVEWDGQTPLNLGTMVAAPNGAMIGGTWNGTTFSAPAPTPPTPAQLFLQKVSSGITISSTGNPSLNGVYCMSDDCRQNMQAVQLSIAAGLGLPGGGQTFLYPDASGVPHAFDSAHFTTLSVAARDYYYNLSTVKATLSAGGSASWPSGSATIQ